MDRIFFIGIIIGVISRIIMLNLDQKQYPSQPNRHPSQRTRPQDWCSQAYIHR